MHHRTLSGVLASLVLAHCSSSASPDAADAATPDAVTLDAVTPDAVTPDAATPDAGVAPTERAAITPRTEPCVDSPTGFGDYGAVRAYERFEVANPAWVGGPTIPVQVLTPALDGRSRPVIFYAHPFGGSDWRRVRSLLEFLVSHDHVVVFTPYATSGATVCQRYDTLWGGIRAATQALASPLGMDLTRVGFMGHSFGGGATPWLAHQAVAVAGWGTQGIFLMPMAPWYSYRMEASSWAAFPSHARMLMMVFDDDDTNDHRIAISDAFNPFPRAKEYLNLVSDRSGACSHTADHVVPSTDSEGAGNATLNGLDTWGVWRHAHALAACTLRGVRDACALVDGSDPPREVAMGTWRSGGGVAPAVRSPNPEPVAPETSYLFRASRRALFPCDRSPD